MLEHTLGNPRVWDPRLHAAQDAEEDGGIDQVCGGVGRQQPQALNVAALLISQTGYQVPGQIYDLPNSPGGAAVLGSHGRQRCIPATGLESCEWELHIRVLRGI